MKWQITMGFNLKSLAFFKIKVETVVNVNRKKWQGIRGNSRFLISFKIVFFFKFYIQQYYNQKLTSFPI